MGTTAVRNDKTYTYKDYLARPENERWEIIDGTAYMMAPPSTEHQRIVGNFFFAFKSYFNQNKAKGCEAFLAPFGVTFNRSAKDEEIITVVEPDITVICDKSKITQQGCKGAPDMIIEVLSPATASYDVIKKRRLYEQNAVMEYWIADPANQIVTKFYANDASGEYQKPEYFSRDDVISPQIFPELAIKLAEIFSGTGE